MTRNLKIILLKLAGSAGAIWACMEFYQISNELINSNNQEYIRIGIQFAALTVLSFLNLALIWYPGVRIGVNLSFTGPVGAKGMRGERGLKGNKGKRGKRGYKGRNHYQ